MLPQVPYAASLRFVSHCKEGLVAQSKLVKVDNHAHVGPAPPCINLNFADPVNTQYHPFIRIKARSVDKGLLIPPGI